MIHNREAISLVNNNIDLLRIFVPEQLQQHKMHSGVYSAMDKSNLSSNIMLALVKLLVKHSVSDSMV